MTIKNSAYKLENIDSSKIITPVSLYQRKTDTARVADIAANFDERIANEPKVSFRDGNYFVFDGQHTVMARIKCNGGKHLPILCKVYYDLSAEDEAKLFAAQTGFSSNLTSGERLRAKAYANDQTTVNFIKANESLGVDVSLSNIKGKYRIRCVSTAFKEFCRIGTDKYCEAIKILCKAWHGKPSSFYVPLIVGFCNFVDLYKDEYDHSRLVNIFLNIEPETFIEEAKSDESLVGVKRYLNWIFNMYNNSVSDEKLSRKF